MGAPFLRQVSGLQKEASTVSFVDIDGFRSLRMFNGIYPPAMNGESNRSVNLAATGNLTVTGTLTIACSELEGFIARDEERHLRRQQSWSLTSRWLFKPKANCHEWPSQ